MKEDQKPTLLCTKSGEKQETKDPKHVSGKVFEKKNCFCFKKCINGQDDLF